MAGLIVGDDGAMDGINCAAPRWDATRGVHVLEVESPWLSGRNAIEVLLPDGLDPARRHPVLYVLPVEAGIGGRFGDGLMAVKASGVHQRHGLICATMAFDTIPWYGRHADDPRKDHEAHLMCAVLPLVERHFPVSSLGRDRRLFGFSKSGFGAVSLLLRHPALFAAACSWDAPLMFGPGDLGMAGTGIHFGTAEQMTRFLPRELAPPAAPLLRDGPPRLTILGRDAWGESTAGFAALLATLGIPHRYDDTLVHAHHWESGWVPRALELFIGT